MVLSVASSPIARPRDCTFAEGDWSLLSTCWFPVAVAGEVGREPVAAKLLDVELVVFRSRGEVRVARDLCPHRGMRLSRGWMSGDQIVCPYHGLHFDGTGRCTAIPADPAASIPDRMRLHLLPTVERYGLIWTSLSGQAPDLPAFEAWAAADYQQIVCHVVDINGAAGRQVEGFLDVAHFAWAHTSTFGDRNNPEVPDYSVARTERGVRVEYLSHVSNYGPAQRHLAPSDFLWRRTFEVFPPFCARLIVHFPDDKKLWILNAASPVSARQTRLFCPLARNFDKDGDVEAVRQFNLRVFNEDRVLVENQKPEDLPLDLGLEVHIAADRTSVAYRRLLKQMGLGLVYVQ